MADFPLRVRVNRYQTDQGQSVQAQRSYLLCELPGLPIVCDAPVDTGAPLTVVPATYARQLAWVQLATMLRTTASAVPSPLNWQGIPCVLGTTTLRCIHLGTGLRSSLLHVIAKFPLRPAVPSLERTIVLGLNLLD